VQSTVDRRMLGVATSATQFIRSIGSTVGTAVVGSIVTRGYAEGLAKNAPPQAPGPLVSALENPQALVSEQARDALRQAASVFPGGEQLVAQAIQGAREALSNSIHDGFVFTLVAVWGAVGAALLVKNIRLEEKPSVETAERGAPDRDAAVISNLADALRRDAAGSTTDEAIAELLVSVDGATSLPRREGAAAALLSLADRIESGNEGYPTLIQTAAGLANGRGGDERERAVHASRTIIRPLAEDKIRP
jgi:hypothetical protein